MITILQLTALNDRDEILLITTSDDGTKRFLHVDRVSPLLEPLDPQSFRHKKLLYGGLNNTIDINIKPHVIFNSIGDPDRCSKMLQRVTNIAEKNNFPYINHPAMVPNVKAERLYALSEGIEGLKTPKCVRLRPDSASSLVDTAAEHGITPPYIVKEVGCDPDRKNSYLMEEDAETTALDRFAFDGRAYDVIKYHDYRSKDGLYRKQRFFVIGETIYPGHLIISEKWKVVNDDEAHLGLEKQLKKLKKEEKHFLKRYQTRQFPALLELKQRLGLDFFAVDCHLTDDEQLLLFSVDCEAHYFERLKEDGYYNDKQIHTYNRAVETMIMTKLQQWRDSKSV